MTGRYATAPAFEQALEQRLKDSSASGAEFARRRGPTGEGVHDLEW
jgi:hypothetical protein